MLPMRKSIALIAGRSVAIVSRETERAPMFYEMRMAAQALRKEGLVAVLKRTWRYLVKWPKYLFFVLKIRHLNIGRDSDIREMVDFSFSTYDGLIMPLQIRSEILLLLDLLQSRPPERVLEIGTSNGGTLFLLSRIATPEACIISIDLPLGAYGGGYPAWKRPFYRAFAIKKQKIHLVRADSHDRATREKVTTILQCQELDLLFIDGDHTYEGAKNDFEMYEPLVRRGGFIALHDIVPHHPGSGCGVDRYWNELKHSHEHIEFIESPDQQGAGLGLIIKGGPDETSPERGRKDSPNG